MAPTTSKFCTVEQVKTHLSIEDSWTGDDAQIEAHIIAATELIRQYTRRAWETGTYTQFFTTRDIEISIGQGSNAAVFRLNEKPLESVTSVVFNTAGKFDDTDPLTEGNGYFVDLDRNAIVLYPGRMQSHARSLKVQYVAGYPIDDNDNDLLLVARNLQMACAVQTAFTFRRVVNETSGKGQKQDKKGFANYSLSNTGLVKDALAYIRQDARILVGSNA